jgi:hypothetical protein
LLTLCPYRHDIAKNVAACTQSVLCNIQTAICH